MKKWIALIGLLLCSVSLRAAPNITVSGNSVTILGSAQTISLTCTLIDPNQTGNLRSGSNIITVFVTSTVTPGNVATCGPIYGNDVITDAFGNANTTYYKVQVFTVSNSIVASTPSLQAFYQFTGAGTVDLSTATPLAPSFMSGSNGSVVIPGSLTVSGTGTFTGGMQCKSFETVFCVDAANTAAWSGSDVGAWINAAYAALPTPTATGTSGRNVGRIDVFPNTSGACYSATTAISFATSGKPVNVDFHGACLNYSALTSGNAILEDPGQSQGYQWSISNLTLLGACATTACSGVTTVGIQLGTTNGAVSGQILNTQIGEFSGAHGFLSGIQSSAVAYINKLDNVTVQGNNIGINFTAGSEGTKFYGGTISNNVTGLQTAGSGAAIQFLATQFDANTTAYNRTSTTTFGVDFIGCHFENPGGGSQPFLQVETDSSTGGYTRFSGGDWQEDRTSGTNAQFVTFAGNFLEIRGTTMFSTGATVTQAINATTGSAHIELTNNAPSLILADVPNAYLVGNRLVDIPLNGTANPVPAIFDFYSLTLNNGSLGLGEIAAPSGVASKDLLWGDSTAHWPRFNPNNAGNQSFVGTTQSTLSLDAVYGTYRVTADQTITAGASLTNIPGLSWTMPANTALNVAFHCEGSYNESTAATSMQFGIQDVTVAPTNIYTKKVAWTSTAAATADNTPTLTTTTATGIGAAFTPSAATTVFNFTLDGMIEQPSNASTSAINIMAQFTTNNGTIKKGSYCRVW